MYIRSEQDVLKKLDVRKNYIPSGVYFDVSKNRYVQFWRGSRSSYIKRACNKKLRKFQGEISNGGNYKRFSEFWNEYW